METKDSDDEGCEWLDRHVQTKLKRAHYKNKPLQTPEQRRLAKNARKRSQRAKAKSLKTPAQKAEDAKRSHFIENWTQMKAEKNASTSSKLVTENFALTQRNA